MKLFMLKGEQTQSVVSLETFKKIEILLHVPQS